MLTANDFDEQVRRVLAMAREESIRLHHEYMGLEHILLGLLRANEGGAEQILRALNIDRNAVRNRIEEIVRRGTASTTEQPFTSRAKRALELSMDVGRELNQDKVRTEHLLIGMLRERKGIAGQVLYEAGVTEEMAIAEAKRLNRQPGADSSEGSE
jgi:ATP-dependent Clp protease ATP-binding subunit ClpA